MRLVLVHGLNYKNKSPKEVRSKWMSALKEAWLRDGLRLPADLSVTVPYYANDLAELSKSSREAIAAGTTRRPSQTEFNLLQEYADAMGVTESELSAAAETERIDIGSVEAGVPHEKWNIVLSRALEDILPTRGKYVAHLFLRHAAVYIERQGARKRIMDVVRSKMFSDDSPIIVVAHSLGTVVSYELLTESTVRNCPAPLFCTLGSPLAVAIVSNYVGTRQTFPRPPVGSWINVLHPEDFVTLGRGIDRSSIGFDGIENDATIVNCEDDKHGIRAYLSTPSIAKAIHRALTHGPTQ